jgi:putative Mn2+ efflux pump MntP
MRLSAVLGLAVGLAMDATAVAAARGLAAPRVRAVDALKVALLFGGFQALMPLLGYLLGAQLGRWAEAWDHWIAFVLLGGLGLKMLWEARGGPSRPEGAQLFALAALLPLAISTSIDAFAAGVTLPLLGAPLPVALLTIGVVTAALSAAGLFAGRRFGALLGPRLDLAGGVILIALGTKILIEHLSAG